MSAALWRTRRLVEKDGMALYPSGSVAARAAFSRAKSSPA